MRNAESQFARKDCAHCGGHGYVFESNESVGKAMKQMRLDAGVGVRQLAGALGKSGSYLVHLEAGRNKWNEARVILYRQMVKILAKEL